LSNKKYYNLLNGKNYAIIHTMKKFETLPSEREKKIRILLLERNQTCKSLAEAMGISEPLLTYKLRNDAWKADDISALINYFKIDPSELLDISEDQENSKKQKD
jgi:hypothetical protein